MLTALMARGKPEPERKATEQTNPFYSPRGQQLRDVRVGRLKSDDADVAVDRAPVRHHVYSVRDRMRFDCADF